MVPLSLVFHRRDHNPEREKTLAVMVMLVQGSRGLDRNQQAAGAAILPTHERERRVEEIPGAGLLEAL
jgi:hypothetical protein